MRKCCKTCDHNEFDRDFDISPTCTRPGCERFIDDPWNEGQDCPYWEEDDGG
jgi:hypothetical protein